jgi:hypothetical protein
MWRTLLPTFSTKCGPIGPRQSADATACFVTSFSIRAGRSPRLVNIEYDVSTSLKWLAKQEAGNQEAASSKILQSVSLNQVEDRATNKQETQTCCP